MRRTILKVFVILLSLIQIGCKTTMQLPVYEPPKPVYIQEDVLRPIFLINDKSTHKEKSEAIVHSYAQCEARVDYLEKVKVISKG